MSCAILTIALYHKRYLLQDIICTFDYKYYQETFPVVYFCIPMFGFVHYFNRLLLLLMLLLLNVNNLYST